MKKQISQFILSIFFLICAIQSMGQFVTVPTKISTPYGKTTIYTQRYAPWMHVFLNDSVVEAKTNINIDDSVHTLQWGKKDKKTIVRPKDTKEIYRVDNYGNRITGIPRDSCWLFAVDTGRIRTYSAIAEIQDPLIGYIQKGEDGPILDLTKENLLPMIADNEKAVKFVEKGKLLKAIKEYNRE
jgi:hypothetical protein